MGKSLNEKNLKRIIHKVIVSTHKDVDSLRNKNKESGMVLDVDDVQYIVDNVAVELKKEANQTQQTVVDLREIDKAIVDLNREIHPD